MTEFPSPTSYDTVFSAHRFREISCVRMRIALYYNIVLNSIFEGAPSNPFFLRG